MIPKACGAYSAISKFYGDKTAKRSGVRLMNHIDEGLKVFELICQDDDHHGQMAYCIHPIIQSTNDLIREMSEETYFGKFGIPPKVLMLAMEYRSTANMFLSYKVDKLTDTELHTIKNRCAKMPSLRSMLIVDKVQNYKDFELYHKDTHERSDELTRYFDRWLEILCVSQKTYKRYKKELGKVG